jgi:hypothetical protein
VISRTLAVAILPTFCLALAGCESTRTLQVSPSNQTKVEYHGGAPLLTSFKRHGVALSLANSEFGDEIGRLPTFNIMVLNRGTEAFDFSPANISALSGETPVKIYTYEEMQKRIKHEANMLAFATALNGASRSMQASQPTTTYSSGTVNAYGSGGYATGNYYGTSTTYNPAATAAAQAQINAQTQNQVATIAATRNAQLASTGTMLRRDTVAPGQTAGATINLHAESIRSGKPLILRVTIDGESHDFVFEPVR